MAHEKLEECVRSNLQLYLDDLQGIEPSNMYDMLLRVVEKPMLELVMEQTRNNQSRAAQWLGLNRNTLRKKLVEHGMLTTSVRS
ncbi:MAG: helix-turn-helix domain-containing protein [Brachymonas denitrificans]|jgi:Fis family transcriptional regulator|uniref:helix-turn-helix domain-containing protein n=1 Tax=Brachymonas denitrificans TaxID=28220 RepID=UPI001BCDE204|nr:helix-turn-helix domain-containing protein [Brachymonas denitrificans]